jgi:transposase-like protein
MARPTDYKPEFAQEAAQMCAEGATDQELADYFGVDVRSLYRWKNTQPEFRQALKAAKESADDRVERSLFERALGYERDEVDIRVVGGEIVQTPIRKFYPPDTTAAIFWLKNRKPEEWRESKAVELTGANGGAVQTAMTVEFVDAGTVPKQA